MNTTWTPRQNLQNLKSSPWLSIPSQWVDVLKHRLTEIEYPSMCEKGSKIWCLGLFSESHVQRQESKGFRGVASTSTSEMENDTHFGTQSAIDCTYIYIYIDGSESAIDCTREETRCVCACGKEWAWAYRFRENHDPAPFKRESSPCRNHVFWNLRLSFLGFLGKTHLM